MLPSAILGILVSIGVLLFVLDLLRRSRIKERHAIWWILASLTALVFAVWPNLLFGLSSLLGVETPSNLVFFFCISILFFVGLQHSSEIARLEEKVRTLTEIVAINNMSDEEQQNKGQ
jgi:hypothetical protein